jgi:hypothetical protein
MKSLIIAVIFSSLFATKADAQTVPVIISRSFNSSFPQADKANWTSTGKFYKAEFSVQGERQIAFFDQLGEFLAVSRYIDFSTLSNRLRLDLVKQFPNYNISELFEVRNDVDTDYYVTLERNGISFILKASENGKWKLFQDGK